MHTGARDVFRKTRLLSTPEMSVVERNLSFVHEPGVVPQQGRDNRSVPGRASRSPRVGRAVTRSRIRKQKKAWRLTAARPCRQASAQAGRFIWQVVGVLEMYDSKVFSRVQVLPVFSTLMLFFASILFQVAR